MITWPGKRFCDGWLFGSYGLFLKWRGTAHILPIYGDCALYSGASHQPVDTVHTSACIQGFG